MEQPSPKFKRGDKLRDQHSGKTGVVSSMHYFEGDDLNPPAWSYSIDSLGFFFYPEYDLVPAI
ncbi:hypothetical protein ABVL22_004272 [Salmonella enterica]